MKKNILYITLAFISLSIPVSASAATVYIESSRDTIAVGDTAVVAVKIDAQGAVLNTVDGETVLKNNNNSIAVDEFSLANSAFGLWPRTPSLSKDGQTISFVGGIPGGFSIEGANIFKFIVVAKKLGDITIAPQNVVVLANDGKGTKVPVTLKNTVIHVVAKQSGQASQNDWAGVVAQDTQSPRDFVIVLGQDSRMFDGKIFAFFSAVDNESGIDHYEVSENGGTSVRSGSTYVLVNQSEDTRITVTAIDKAGNKKVSYYPVSGQSRPIAWGWVLVISLVGFFGYKIACLKWRS